MTKPALHSSQSASKMPIIWCIGGSDSSAGAGIQADLLTANALQVHACTLISAITAQNSISISDIRPCALNTFAAQWQQLAQDMPPKAIKISMLANAEQVSFLAEQLPKIKAQYPALQVIYDPVLKASCDQTSLTKTPLLVQIRQHLLPMVDLLTPNLNELAALSQQAINFSTPEQLVHAGKALLKLGVKQVLIKGGHGDNSNATITDYWLAENQAIQFCHARIHTQHGHGTGCVLASSIASFIAQDYPMADAITLAISYLQQGLTQAAEQNYQLGQGADPLKPSTWPTSLHYFPEISPLNSNNTQGKLAFAACDKNQMALYPVVDSIDWLAFCLAHGVKTAQLRIKQPKSPTDLTLQIKQAIALGKQFQAQVFINDHWQLAIELGAFGVHLGQEDLQTADLSAISQAGLALGVSTHGYFELIQALQLNPSYIALGHIFATQTKQMPSKPQGLSRLQRYVQLCQQQGAISVAIGGIKHQHCQTIRQLGVDSIALVTAITQAKNPKQSIQQLQQAVTLDKRFKELSYV